MSEIQLESALHIRTAADVQQVRARLLRLVFGDKEWPAAQVVTVQPDGALIFEGPYGMQFQSQRYQAGGNRVVLYCEGHAGHWRHSQEAIDAFLAQGWDVIAMAMPLLGPNSAGDWQGKTLREHGDFAALPAPIEPFMVPWTVLYEYASRLYGDIIIAGVSGGGWSCSLYAALDERVRLSVPVAGVWPRALRGHNDIGDFEQQHDPLWETASYLDRFVMASVGRRQVQIFNRHDPACFAGDAALQYTGLVQNRLREIGAGGTFEVLIDETHKEHKFSAWAVEAICRR